MTTRQKLQETPRTNRHASGVTLAAWLYELTASEHGPSDVAPDDACATPDALGLLALFAIPIRDGRRQLRAGLQELRRLGSAVPVSDSILESQLLNHLLGRLKLIAERTLALELQVASIQGELHGDTPAARFDSFTARLRQPAAALAILGEYPVLAEQALNCINQWLRFSLQFVRHLAADWGRIQQTFLAPADVGDITEIQGDAGDRHADGKAVILLRFTSGFRLVYKPRSLAVDLCFQELLAWCNARGASPPLRTLLALNEGDHGWVEFVEAESCETRDQLQRFYQRQGLYLALLYLLQATDFHFENLIAAGEHPVLVDLETLFHERLPGTASTPPIRGMSNSIVSIGILPRVSYYEGFDRGVDFSGLGASTGQEIETPTYEFQAAGTDEMRLDRIEMHTLAGNHRPQLAGDDVSPGSFAAEIHAGFTSMYQLLLQHREALLAEEGPLAPFAAVETRFIARATQIYGLLLEQSFHPDFLRNPADRSRWFEQLWSQAKEAVGLQPLVAAERAELERNDIPLFHLRPGSTDLWTARGERIANFFPQTPLATVRQRLATLGPDDLARQTWLLQVALAKLQQASPVALVDLTASPLRLDGKEAVEAAITVGEQLRALCWQDDEEAGWLGVQQRERGWFVDAIGLEEGGLLEVATLLAQLDRITGESRHGSLLAKAIRSINRLIQDSPQPLPADWRDRAETFTAMLSARQEPELRRETARMTEVMKSTAST